MLVHFEFIFKHPWFLHFPLVLESTFISKNALLKGEKMKTHKEIVVKNL